MEKIKLFLLVVCVMVVTGTCFAQEAQQAQDAQELQIIDTLVQNAQPAGEPIGETEAAQQPVVEGNLTMIQPLGRNATPVVGFDPVKYTLGPEDVIQIDVMRHSEFSGVFPVNLEGKIQLKFIGDVDVTGLTKKDLEDKIKKVIGSYVINPEVNVTIMEYKSKVIYVVGEVGNPGKFFMRSESIPVREALVAAGLPMLTAAMRRCRLITPGTDGKAKTIDVDVYSLLYQGNLNQNLLMRPGDVLYVPATIMAKIMRIINPVTAPVSSVTSTAGTAGRLAVGGI